MAAAATGQDETDGMAAVWLGLPDRMLADFRTERPGSDLARLLKTARRIREAVDRVVLLGDRELLAGPRAVFEACSHPHHNELPRCERGGRPRLSFGGCDFDNDATQGLLDLVAPRRDAGGVASGPQDAVDLLDRWGMVVVDRGGGAFGTAATMRVFLATLLGQMGDGAAELVVPITAAAAPLTEVARRIGCVEAFSLPPGGGPTSVFTAAGLLPSAIVGIDVVRLLEGAVSMHRRFREAPVAANPVLQFAGVAHLADTRLGGPRPMLVPWNSRLEGVCRWYDLLRAGSALSGSVADPGRPRRADGPLVTRLRVAEPRRDRLSLPAVELLAADEDQLAGLVGTTWPALQDAAVTAAREAEVAAGRPTADLLLPRLDEHAVGQLLEMLMLATLVESRLGASPAAGTSPA
jgi:glucose-6-phosphate isomerase